MTSLRRTDQSHRASASVTAEHVVRYLDEHRTTCPHISKYNVNDFHTPRYPGRLGFFHANGSRISYLNTNNLCVDCLDALIPTGFNFVSLYSHLTRPSGSDLPKRWLRETQANSKTEPEDVCIEVFQCGTEAIPNIRPTTIPLLQGLPEAKAAWQWLEKQRKPFYIDQLHLAGRGNASAEKNAARDSLIAQKVATPFNPTETPNETDSPDLSMQLKSNGVSISKETRAANEESPGTLPMSAVFQLAAGPSERTLNTGQPELSRPAKLQMISPRSTTVRKI